ncbi:alpha/beta hydrolase [Shewanella sp. NIFS-20-20]|uniref:alpha/beta hydrolase n=1 Tax=Shewanella sp. NIFS-20-20 TaxID=2853806 RepID=UPI001C4666D2|nr:dienelactone hydrolase family protein [Shewanella sp. NIFS-20-20]MBV7314302.1 lysophospholipase [Shewanella sp. NIFS-20-20]
MNIKTISILLLLATGLGCSNLEINETNFIRNRSDTILYTLITQSPLTTAQLAEITQYSEAAIVRSIAELEADQQVEQHQCAQQACWQLGHEYYKQNQEYADKVRGFSLAKIDADLRSHQVLQHRLSAGTISVVELRAKQPQTTLVFFGGNGFRINPELLETIAKLLTPTTSLFVADYRGIGASHGTPQVQAILNDVNELITYVDQRPDLAATKTVYYGFSLGSFAAAYAANHIVPDGLILESTATNIVDWINGNIPWYGRLVYQVRVGDELKALDNIEQIKKITAPILFLSGEQDRVTPIEMTRELYEHALLSRFRELQSFSQAEHGTINQMPNYQDVIQGFLARL